MTLRLRKIRSLVNCLMLFPVISAFSPSAARAEEISVTQYGQSLYGLPFAVALEKGLFKKSGIDITGILSSGGGGSTA